MRSASNTAIHSEDTLRRINGLNGEDARAIGGGPFSRLLRSRIPAYKYVLALLDWLGVMASLQMVWHAYTPPGVPFPMFTPGPTVAQIMVALSFSGLGLFIYHGCRLYKINVVLSTTAQLRGIFLANAYTVLCFTAALMFIAGAEMATDNVLAAATFFLLSSSISVILRLLFFRSIFSIATRYGLYSRSLLVLGTGTNARRIAHALIANRAYGLRVAGFLDHERPVGSEIVPGVPVMGRLEDIARLVEQGGIDELVVCVEHLPEEQLLALFDRCVATGARVTVASSAYDVIPLRLFKENYGDVPLIGVGHAEWAYAGVPELKRVGDVVVAFIGLILQSPILLAIALAIKLDSPGPVFFRQTRVGKGGRLFHFYKFRSMYVGDDTHAREEQYAKLIQGSHAAKGKDNPTKIVDESRITRVGRFIRRTSLDELPQLYNVLKGDMSLVGPRPCLPYEWRYYDEWHKRRLNVTPGCTGVWQVLGRSHVDFREMVILDLYYIQNPSFRLDAWLVLKTIPVMLFGRGGK